MLEKLQMYINGEWVDSHSTETIEVMNPSDDSVLGVITAGNSDDVDKAVAAAKAAFVDFSFSTKEERVQILENIITEYEKRSEELAETISKEMGAPIWLSQVAQVASGQFDQYQEKGIFLWDIAAGLSIIKAAGGNYTFKSYSEDQFKVDVVANNNCL